MPQLAADYSRYQSPRGIEAMAHPALRPARLYYLERCEEALLELLNAAEVKLRGHSVDLVMRLDDARADWLAMLGSALDELEPDDDREEDDPAEDGGDTELEGDRILGGLGL